MRRTVTGLASFLFAFVLSVAGLFGQNLPDQFEGWQTKRFQPISTQQLPSVAGDDAAVIREYGFVSAERRTYSKDGSDLTITLWRMKDATGSFGLFTFLRAPGMNPVEAEDPIANAPDRSLMQRGVCVLDVAGRSLSLAEAKPLLAAIPSLRTPENVLPPLLGYLPETNLVPHSGKLIVGPRGFARLGTPLPSTSVGFDIGAEAEIAQYRIKGKLLQLLLVSYPTPQLAAKKLEQIQKLPALSPTPSETQVKAQREGSLLAFALNSPDQETAQALLDGIHQDRVLTWDQYVPTAKDNLAAMLLTITYLAGFLLLFAVVAGIAFGGIRVLAKKFLPFPVFDRPSQVEIIRLRLSGK